MKFQKMGLGFLMLCGSALLMPACQNLTSSPSTATAPKAPVATATAVPATLPLTWGFVGNLFPIVNGATVTVADDGWVAGGSDTDPVTTAGKATLSDAAKLTAKVPLPEVASQTAPVTTTVTLLSNATTFLSAGVNFLDAGQYCTIQYPFNALNGYANGVANLGKPASLIMNVAVEALNNTLNAALTPNAPPALWFTLNTTSANNNIQSSSQIAVAAFNNAITYTGAAVSQYAGGPGPVTVNGKASTVGGPVTVYASSPWTTISVPFNWNAPNNSSSVQDVYLEFGPNASNTILSGGVSYIVAIQGVTIQ